MKLWIPPALVLLTVPTTSSIIPEIIKDSDSERRLIQSASKQFAALSRRLDSILRK